MRNLKIFGGISYHAEEFHNHSFSSWHDENVRGGTPEQSGEVRISTAIHQGCSGCRCAVGRSVDGHFAKDILIHLSAVFLFIALISVFVLIVEADLFLVEVFEDDKEPLDGFTKMADVGQETLQINKEPGLVHKLFSPENFYKKIFFRIVQNSNNPEG